MADRTNLTVAHAFFDAWNAGDLSLADPYWSDDLVAERPGAPGPMDKQQTRMYHQNFLSAFPDSQFEILLTVADDDYVVDHWSASGTNTGTLYSPSGAAIPPSGRSIVVKGTLTSEVKDGKVFRSWGYFDMADLLGQIGVLPPM